MGDELVPVQPAASRATIEPPTPFRGRIVPQELYETRRHPDVRIERRASTIARLAKVISERDVSVGLRQTLLTQEERRAWGDRVLAALAPCLDGVDTVVFLAAQRYRQFLEPELHERGLAVRVPGAAAAPGEAAAGTVGRGPGRAPRPGRPNTRPVELPRGFGRD